MSDCVCGTISNIGAPNCPALMDIVKNLIFTSAITEAGVDNKISTANAKVFTNVETLLNVATPRKGRWYPTPELENLTDLRDDSVYQEFTSGAKAFIREGFRNVYAFVPNGDAEFYARMKDMGRCNNIGAYGMDQPSNLIGSKRTQTAVPFTQLYPILIDRNSWNVQFLKATDSTVQGIAIMFQWKSSEKDEYLAMIPNSTMDWDREKLYGLFDVYATAGAVSQTDLVVTVYLQTASSQVEKITGLVAADFKIYNNTTSAAVTVTGCTETVGNPGQYTLTFASQTVNDELTVSMSKNRYDSELGLETLLFTVV